MKIAFLMLAHKNPKQINLLLDALRHPAVDVFVHVDKKSKEIRKRITQRPNVYILPEQQCVDVQWGKYSIVEATLQLIEAAVNWETGGYDYYWLISGQDYPLCSAQSIIEFLEANLGSDFIECSPNEVFKKRNDVYFFNALIGQKLWQKALKTIWIYLTGGWERTFSVFKRKAPKGVNYWFGSAWWCLYCDTLKKVVEFLHECPDYVYFFNHSLCPDECFFQTIVMNLRCSENVRTYLHYVKWKKGANSPQILTIDDYYSLVASGKLMARKFDLDVDGEILRKLEKGE